MISVAGLVFSNIHDTSLPELTSRRTMASVPFGGRYRLVDFTLSNMVNSGISKIGIITHNNYHSLLDHIGNGKDWDMSRRSGGIKILPPLISAFENGSRNILPTGRLEALEGVIGFISSCGEDHILLSDCDTVCNIDLRDLFKVHSERGAKVTVITAPMTLKNKLGAEEIFFAEKNEDGLIRDIYSAGYGSLSGDGCTNIMLFDRKYLLSALSNAVSRGYRDFYRDLFSSCVKQGQVFAYSFEGVMMKISSLEDYYECSMELLRDEVRKSLFGTYARPIYTKVRNSPPTVYREGSRVKNSCIADGCVIEGTVENSIIFRGVKIGKGAVIKNSVLMQDSFVGEGVELNYAISDKDVVIREHRRLFGYRTMPLFMAKGTIV